MKVAIIQEWFVTVGGSDKVTEALFDIFPDADIYTLVAYRESARNRRYLARRCIGRIKNSSLGKV